MAADGVDAASEPLRKLEQADLDRADVVVVFDRLPEGLTARHVTDWTDLGSIVSNYDQTRPVLDARITILFEQLEPASPHP